MSSGRIARAHRRYPTARRRTARYQASILARRPAGLPPHLLPGVTGREERRGLGYWRFVIAGAVLAILTLIVGIGLFVASTAAAVAGTVEAYRRVNESLPNAASVFAQTFETTRIYDRNGVLLTEVEAPEGGYREFVTLDQIAPVAIDATVAAEDATFWSHYGVEPIAILRGAVINLTGAGSSGGSTITQQLARGLYPDEINPNDISFTRKFKEALAAVELDRKFSKEDILTMYLNQIFYGQRSYGIEAAAQTYFRKHASELNLAEASLLAGLPQAPSYYDPTYNFDIAKKRQQYVLNQMVKYGYITRAEADAAFREPLQPKTRSGGILHAPHFTIYVQNYLKRVYGEDAYYRGGLQVYTTLDVELQARAEEIVRQGVAANLPYGRNNAALVAIVPWSGEILAMVGSADFNDAGIGGQNNYALALLQPGSSIKPVIYAAAFESGWNPGTVIMDTSMEEPCPTCPGGVWRPQNYTGLFYGAVSVRTALANSLNIPAIKAGKFAGIEHAYELAKRMGVRLGGLPEPWYNYGLSFSIGTGEVSLLEHTNVYATLANNGRYVPANPILRIEDGRGNVLYDLKDSLKQNPGEQVLRAEYAYQITSILTDNAAREMVFGRGNLFEQTAEALGRPTAAKSGTTDGWKDIWTMGYTTDLAVGVWSGQTSATGDAATQLPPRDGIEGAGPIWQAMMIAVHQNPQWASYLLGPNGQPLPKEFPRPAGIEQRSICVATGHQASGGFETRTEVLVRDEGPALACDQLSADELAELRYALNDLQRNGGKYTGRGQDSIWRYASAVGVSSGRGPSSNSGSSSGSGGSPPIQPRSGT